MTTSISKSDKKFIKLFTKYFTPYLIITVIFIIASASAYGVVYNKIEDYIMSQQDDYLNHYRTYLDHIFTYIQDTTIKLLSTESITSFAHLRKDYVDNNYYTTVSLLNEIDDIVIDYSYIDQYYIFYKNSNKVVLNGRSLTTFDSFYGKQFTYGDMAAEEFYDMLFRDIYLEGQYHPNQPTIYLGQQREAFLITQTISFDFKGSIAVLVFVMNSNKIAEYMTSNQGLHHLLTIKDNKAITITEISNMDELLSSNPSIVYSQSSAQSTVMPLTYHLQVEKTSAYKSLNEFKKFCFYIYFLLLIFTFIISYYYAKKYSKPVIQLMEDHQQLSIKIMEQQITLRQSFVEKWLHGNFETEEELLQMVQSIDANQYIDGLFVVTLLDFYPISWDKSGDDYEEIQATDIIEILSILSQYVERDFICQVSPNRIALIFTDDSRHHEKLKLGMMKKIDCIQQALDHAGYTHCLYSVGTIENDILNVSQSFNNAKDLLIHISHIPKVSQRILICSPLMCEHGLYYYPCDIETRLINCVQAGKISDVHKILHDLFEANILERALTSDMLDAFIYELCGTYIKLQERILTKNSGMTDESIELFKKVKQSDPLGQIQLIRKSFIDLSQLIKKEKENQYSSLMENMEQYINENYPLPNMSLSLLADKYGFTEVYISQLFKNYFHTNFIQYLQEIRMAKARELLLTTELPIKDIMTQVGYCSLNTFTRAFKRINGVTATEYKKKNRNSYN
ncbi:AraC family transcriptional regulator [Vallitalea okinawensis]|uniref:AraC family transcriptional regulator n=1 Tax=Vallitalea okinawensis TaxID=2078660 RepID=UPI000CFD0EE6|nr:AraC family transcriptional regulator [Vallitalea okinawensis]